MRNSFGPKALETLLAARLPRSWRVATKAAGRREVDALIELQAPDGVRGVAAVQRKGSLAPKDVEAVLSRLAKAAPDVPWLVYSRFLSPRTRELLRAADVSFADDTGNLRLVLSRPGLFVETAGLAKDPETEPRSLGSLKGPAAGRVVRALCDLDPPYGIRELSERAEIPLGSVARVAGFLTGEAVVRRDEAGRISAVDRPALIRRWAQDYGLQKSNRVSSYLAPRGLSSVQAGLERLRGYCITGSLAASRRAPVAPSRLAAIYAEEPSALADSLGLQPADAGANVLLLEPYDGVVFERTWSEDNLTFAALSQVAADLLTSPGRGPSEGEALLRWMSEHVEGWRA